MAGSTKKTKLLTTCFVIICLTLGSLQEAQGTNPNMYGLIGKYINSTYPTHLAFKDGSLYISDMGENIAIMDINVDAGTVTMSENVASLPKISEIPNYVTWFEFFKGTSYFAANWKNEVLVGIDYTKL